MAQKTRDGERLPILICPTHGEYIADAPDSPCPACEDEAEETGEIPEE